MPHSSTHKYSPEEPTDGGKFSSGPNTQLGFEIVPHTTHWNFSPEFYPDDFTQMKKKKLNRYTSGCSGESVDIKKIKNREFHAAGVILEGEIPVFQSLLDYEQKVDLISPLSRSKGMECYVKQGELGNQKGWDPHTRQWMFEYSLDLVSTGRDEHDTGNNAIISAIAGDTMEIGGQTYNTTISNDPTPFSAVE
jgi:hypothetical protein